MGAGKPPYWHIGVIGGSGLSQGLALDDAQEIEVASPFGKPSGPVTTGTLAGRRFTVLARHGEGHAIPPGEVDYRANIDALKRCGVTDVIALSAIGSLREEIAPGSFVAVDQFIDRTQGRARSFFGEGLVAHVGLAEPVCARLAGMLAQSARAAGAQVHEGGTYVAIEGPQFSTRAESEMFRSFGANVIGMTAMPEARLAREAELPYALLGMVTDWDGWRQGSEPVSATEVFAVMKQNAQKAQQAISALAAALPDKRDASPIDTALDTALVTAEAARDRSLMARLDAVAGRVLDGG